jgi:hypothetical protein
LILVVNIYSVRISLEQEIGTRKAKIKNKKNKVADATNGKFESVKNWIKNSSEKILWRDSIPLALTGVGLLFLFLTLFNDC